MRKLAKLFVLAALLALAPALASAQVTLGARLGYGLAMGQAMEDADLSDGIKAQIPIQLDAGYRITPAFTLGGYFSYGFGLLSGDVSDMCDAGDFDCSVRVYRLGVQADYRFQRASASPWIGAGIGYEWASLRVEGGGDERKESYKGWELLNLQGGVDWKVGEKFSVGPFAMLSIGQYSRASVDEGGGSVEVDIPDKALHQWLQIGIRGKFDL